MDLPEVETYHHLSDKSREVCEEALPRSRIVILLRPLL